MYFHNVYVYTCIYMHYIYIYTYVVSPLTLYLFFRVIRPAGSTSPAPSGFEAERGRGKIESHSCGCLV